MFNPCTRKSANMGHPSRGQGLAGNRESGGRNDSQTPLHSFALLWLVWQGGGGVLVKKVDRANQEIVPECRHDRPVFQADNVVEAQRVPTNNVRVLDGTIRLGPFRQPAK